MRNKSATPAIEIPEHLRMAKPEFLLFDLDGTLVDTAPDLSFCIDNMLQALGQRACGEDQARLWIGNGIDRLVRRALVGRMEGEPSEALYRRAMPIFMALYADHAAVHSQVYPGVIETLKQLHANGYPMGCVTNKARRFTEKILHELGLEPYLPVQVCGDDLPVKKPDPTPLLHASALLGFEARHGLMVGDSRSDARAAQAAGMPIVCVTTGYNHGRDVAEYEPDLVIDGFEQLLAIFCLPN